MSEQPKTYEFLYTNYKWPEPGATRDCPFSGEPLKLNPRNASYGGKPWTCPKCVYYFSEEELDNWKPGQQDDCPTLKAREAAEK